MRLGIDITPLQSSSPGGIGVATYETVRVLAAVPGLDVILYGTREAVMPFSGLALDFDLPRRVGSGPLAGSNIAWLQFAVGGMLRQDGVDVFWGTRQVLPRNAPMVAKVATLYDFWHIRHPEQQPLVNRILNRYVVWATARDADVLTAISEDTARDARHLLSLSSERVRTVPLGVDALKFAAPSTEEADAVLVRLGVVRPYVLCMDVYNPRKNFKTLLGAAAIIAAEVPRFEIVGLGRPRKTAREVHVAAEAATFGVSDRLRLIGDVEPADLRALYGAAEVFVYPSVYEGFGMPVLEAMAAGAPVVISRTSSLPEVAGDSAITVDPTSVPEITVALHRIFTDADLRARMRDSGRSRAMDFTWERTAEGMLRAFETALEIHALARS